MDEKRARFEAQVLPHLDAAHRFARCLAHAPADADDIVQEAYLRAFRSFDTLRGSDAKSWLMAIVRNCHFTAARQQQRRGFVPLPGEDEADHGRALVTDTVDPERESVIRDEQRTLDALLAGLTEEQRTVLVLREVEEMTYSEIAAVMNLPIGTVMSRLARSRAALKTCWLRQAPGEPRAVR